MKKKNLVAVAFVTAVLGIMLGEVSEGREEQKRIEDIKNQIAKEADEYLSQLIVQERYITATRIVWVYGCADKS